MVSEHVHVVVSLLTLEPGRPGGSETNARGVLKELSGGLPGVHTTVLATQRVRGAYADLATHHLDFAVVARHPGAKTVQRRAAAFAFAPLLGRLARHRVPATATVVHYPFTVPFPRLPGPSLVTMFDVNHHDLPHMWSKAQREYRRVAYDSAARRATMIITASEYARDRLVDVLGIDRLRVHVIGLGIDGERFTPTCGEADEELAATIPMPARFVLYPAALWPHKNHRRLMEAMPEVSDDVHLVLTGQDHGAWQPLEDLARRAGVLGRVHHLGFVAGHLVAALYRRAEAVVFPSLYEGFGAPPLEAMACGCPVASSLRTSLRELCQGAVVELDPDDPRSIATSINQVVEDTPLRDHLVAEGYRRSGSFTWRAAAEAHVVAYRGAAAAATGS